MAKQVKRSQKQQPVSKPKTDRELLLDYTKQLASINTLQQAVVRNMQRQIENSFELD